MNIHGAVQVNEREHDESEYAPLMESSNKQPIKSSNEYPIGMYHSIQDAPKHPF